MVAESSVEIDLVVERIRSAWRDLRRAGSAGPLRVALYHPDPPLDVAQADALDVVISHAPVRMSELATLLRVNPSTATRTVARLHDQALVERYTDKVDTRVVLVTPSERGRRLHGQVLGKVNGLLVKTLATFDPSERELLASLMERLVEAADGVARAHEDDRSDIL